MKPEESLGSVVPGKQDSTEVVPDSPSKDPTPAGSGATGKHNVPGRKSATESKINRETAASMLSAKKAKRASHRRHIRRSHANG